jgi:nucleotide-binding universal stress UspA family protein
VLKNRILIPLNTSELSKRIIPYIERFFSAQENELILFHITKLPRSVGLAKPDPGSGYALQPGGEPVGPKPHPIYAHQQEDSIKANVEAELLPITNHLRERGYAVTVMVDFTNNPVDDILSVIDGEFIDLVAMSTRAQEGFLLFFFSDIVDQLSQKAGIPVLIFHPAEA